MFKVLIVDDEIYVVILIQKLIDWQALGMNVVDVAHDGIKALQLVKEKKPDLVIVNAGMKGYDGLPFLDRVREFDQQVRLIVVSGVGQFEYARKALRNDVEDYLLKPINKAELEETLSSVRRKLISQRTEAISRQELEQDLIRSRRMIQADLLRGMTTGTLNFTNEEAAAVNSQYFTSFSERGYRLFSFHVEEEAVTIVEDLRERLEAELKLELRECCTEMISYAQDKHIVCLCNYKQPKETLLDSRLKQKICSLNTETDGKQAAMYTLCLGNCFHGLSEIRTEYLCLSDCIHARVSIGIGKIIEVKDLRIDKNTIQELVKPIEGRFLKCLIEHDMDTLKWLIREVFSKSFVRSRKEPLLYDGLYHQLLRTAFKHMTDNGMITMEFQEFEKDFYRNYASAVNVKQIADSLSCGISRIVVASEADSLMELPSMHIIKQYIADHYAESIRLSTLAELVNLDPVYFSRVFKKEEKIGFMEYLHQYRITMAKKMLMNVRYNIDEVATRTGFQDTRYFSRLFKRTVGMTPTEYRKKKILCCYAQKEEGCSG